MYRESYPSTRVKRVRAPYASINSRGEIVLNARVFPLLGGLNYVSLHYNDETHDIRIARPTTSGRVFNVRRFGRGGRLRVIRCRLFLKRFGIRVTQTQVFTDIRYSRDPDTVILNLRTARSANR